MQVFNENFNDRIVFSHRDLDTIFTYIRQNPYRLAIRREHPEFFRKVRNIFIGRDAATATAPSATAPSAPASSRSAPSDPAPSGSASSVSGSAPAASIGSATPPSAASVSGSLGIGASAPLAQEDGEEQLRRPAMAQGYGNLFLLRNPFKISLVVHRRDSDEEFERKKEECLYNAANGGVVVSTFISPREKEVRAAIEAIGGRIILLSPEVLEERQKPAKHNFELCCAGELLLVAPLEFKGFYDGNLRREQCLRMNFLAEEIAAERFQAL